MKHCSIPVHYQKEVIRSALALKLHCYKNTDAILAALTSSLPEIWNEGARRVGGEAGPPLHTEYLPA